MESRREELENMHDYMLLARYQQDLEYYFGHGNKHAKHLFFLGIEEHMKRTRDQWEKVDPKPEWFTREELEQFEQQVKGEQNGNV